MHKNSEEERFEFYCKILEEIDPDEVDEWLDQNSPDLAAAVGDGPAPPSVHTERLEAQSESGKTEEVWPERCSMRSGRKATVETRNAADNQPEYANAA